MNTKSIINFIKLAAGKKVFVDIDGTLIKTQHVPQDVVGNKGGWWIDNLSTNDLIYSRLALCIILKIFGCSLVIWTNRFDNHIEVTKKNLGLFWYLFSDYQFYSGKKKTVYNNSMIVIDDSKQFKGNNTLLVSKI